MRARAELADQLEIDMAAAAEKNEQIWSDLRKEQVTRKKLHNQVQDLKGALRVFARCRPMSNSEQERGCETCVEFLTPQEMSVELEDKNGNGQREEKLFKFGELLLEG